MTDLLAIPTALIVGLAAVQVAALESEWSDLHERCMTSVTKGERLNVTGLQERLPNVTVDIIDQEPFGQRLEFDPLGPGGRTLPTSVWAAKDGRLEMWLIEYPTRAGFRAICEVRQGRGTVGVTEAEASQLRELFIENLRSTAHSEVPTDTPSLSAFQLDQVNARGCPVITSFSADAETGYFRTSVSEAIGAADCGGASLGRNLITPHGVVPPTAQGG
jgi:hypothetical protein